MKRFYIFLMVVAVMGWGKSHLRLPHISSFFKSRHLSGSTHTYHYTRSQRYNSSPSRTYREYNGVRRTYYPSRKTYSNRALLGSRENRKSNCRQLIRCYYNCGRFTNSSGCIQQCNSSIPCDRRELEGLLKK